MKKILLGIFLTLCGAGAASAQIHATTALEDSTAYYVGTAEGSYASYSAALANNPAELEAARSAVNAVFNYPSDNLEPLRRAIKMREMIDEFNKSGVSIDRNTFISAFDLATRRPAPSREQLDAIGDSANDLLRRAHAVAEEVNKMMRANEIKKNKAEGEAFLAAAKKKDKSIITTPSGLSYKVVKSGRGPHPTDADRVRVHYTGRLTDGKVFDSSVERGEPATFGVTQVIPGWTEGLKLMTPGSKYTFYIPSDLAYGDRGAGKDIKPGQMLVFDVELLGIEPQKK